MKKLLNFAIFCVFAFLMPAFSDTETLNWMVDGQTYATTTCETGGDISLPTTPTKSGYTFVGCREVTNRGTFSTWDNVPTDTSIYTADTQSNRVPQKYDYIIIEDASGYRGIYDKEMHITKTQAIGAGDTASVTYTFTVGEQVYTMGRKDRRNVIKAEMPDIGIYVRTGGSTNYDIRFFSDAAYTVPIKIKYNNQFVTSIPAVWSTVLDTYVYYAYSDTSYTGSWRFVYMGDWDTDGKEGWVPTEQLE